MSLHADRRWVRCLVPAVILASLLFASGCDSTEDFDHTPAPGTGALLVDNHGDRDVSVYVNGALVGEVNDGDWKAFDVTPGVPRVVLDETDGDRSFGADVDILEGKNTVLDVSVQSPSSLFVTLSIED